MAAFEGTVLERSRLTCNLCWALDSDLVCSMHRQLTPSHAQQIVSGI